MIERTLRKTIKNHFFQRKTLVITGPRQVGKSTFIRDILKDYDSHLFFDGDDPVVREMLETVGYEKLKVIIGTEKIVYIDEAQRIPNIGLTMKIIHDRFPEVQLLATGSSSLDLGNILQEPMTGRKFEFLMLPISWAEWHQHVGYMTTYSQLDDRLIYGMYPEVLTRPGEEKDILKELAANYLYKDIFALTGIKKPEVLEKLVRALAFQVGNEVSYNELSQLVGIDKNTIQVYIDLLEKAFVVYRLSPLSRNARNEIRMSQKVYFYDNGIRNAVIGDFNPLNLRNDVGALWENFILSERLKFLKANGFYGRRWFWRTTRGQEIDYLEEKDGQIKAFEIKFSEKPKLKVPPEFARNYEAEFNQIHRGNFYSLLVPGEA